MWQRCNSHIFKIYNILFHNQPIKSLLIRNAYFHSPCNLGSELESAREESFEGNIEEEVGEELYLGSPMSGVHDRGRKHTLFDKMGSARYLDSANSRNPFRHSYIDVRVYLF